MKFLLFLLYSITFLPIIAGSIGLGLPLIGIMPGQNVISQGVADQITENFQQFFTYPGVFAALIRTVLIGVTATSLSVLFAVLVLAVVPRRLYGLWSGALVLPLAAPPLALGLGVLMLFSSSGWAVRALDMVLNLGLSTPPDWPLAPDPYGIFAILALAMKETPFLIMAGMAAMMQMPALRQARVLAGLGYQPASGFLRFQLPLVYGRIRRAVIIALVFSLSSTDVPGLLLPGNTPTLPLLILRFNLEANLNFQAVTAVAALVQAGLVGLCLAGLFLLERLIAKLFSPRRHTGKRSGLADHLNQGLAIPGGALWGLVVLGLLVAFIWSLAWRMGWPDLLPDRASFYGWRSLWAQVNGAFVPSFAVALAAAMLSLPLVLAGLEQRRQQNWKPAPLREWLILLPLVIPEPSLMTGLQVNFLLFRFEGTGAALLYAHMIYVLPYLYLMLHGPYRRLDPRYIRQAHTLRMGPTRTMIKIILPILLRPLLLALAVGFAVGLGLFLPTIVAGAGRIETLTTASFALASNGDLRVVGAAALLLMGLPLAGFLLSSMLSGWQARNRQGLKGAGKHG